LKLRNLRAHFSSERHQPGHTIRKVAKQERPPIVVRPFVENRAKCDVQGCPALRPSAAQAIPDYALFVFGTYAYAAAAGAAAKQVGLAK